jgi:hypothetical protein
MAFTIPDLTPDTRHWRIDWFGEVAYQTNGQRYSQSVYRVLISPVTCDSLPSLFVVTDDGIQHEVWLPIGTLPMVCIGDIWQHGERIAQPMYCHESFNIHIANSSTDIIKAGLSLENIFLLPLNEYRWHLGATQSYCICVSMQNGKRLIVPCMELIRFYFGSSSKLLHKLFAGPLREEILWREKSFASANEHLHIKLANKISGASASDIGRIALSSDAWRSAAGIYASCVASTTQKRTAYPYTNFPFTGQTNLQVSGQWLPFAGVPNSTFIAYRIQSCSHQFPFKSLSYEIEAFTTYRGTPKQTAESANNSSAWAKPRNGAHAKKSTLSNYDPDTKKSDAKRINFSNAKFLDLSNKSVWLEKIDTLFSSGIFMKHADGSIEQVAFGEGMIGGQGRETDIIHADADRGYDPNLFKLPGFVTLGIKVALAAAEKIAFSNMGVTLTLMIAPGYSEPVFPLPRLVDEEGVIDTITDCSNANMLIRQRRACFLRIEDVSCGIIMFNVVIEAQKMAMPPVVRFVENVQLEDIMRML